MSSPAARLALLLLGAAALPVSGLLDQRPRGLAEGRQHHRQVKHDRTQKEEELFVSNRTQPIRVHVTSIGGVGTTGFIEELRKMNPRIITNDPIDNDQIKHLPYGKLKNHGRFLQRAPDKIIYLHGDPTRAVMSVDRRGWFMIQARKTRQNAFPHPFPKNMHQYVDFKDDFFEFENHFDSFRDQCDYPIAFLRIGEKTDHLNELAEFLDTSVSEVRAALVPWQQVRMAEYTAELEVANKTPESLELRTQEILQMYKKAAGDSSVVPLAYNPDAHPSSNDYSDVSQEIKDKLHSKLSSLIKKYDDLPGLKVLNPSDKSACRSKN